MSKIRITIKGIAAELVLGNYLPSDKTIFENWEEFFHYNSVLHVTQLIADYISEIEILKDEVQLYKGKIPANQFVREKSFLPNMIPNGIYLRTECVENAVYSIETEIENFDLTKLKFSTQDYELLFKTANDFVSEMLYDNNKLDLTWVSAVPVGSICLLCGYQNGLLVPIYDAVTKKYAQTLKK